MKSIRSLMLLVGIVFLATGCASQKFLPDGTLFAADTVTDSLDRSGTVFGLYQPTGEKKPDGTPVYKKVSAQLVHGSTIVGQALVGATNGIGVALIQQHTALKVADKTACNGPTCGNGTVIINDGSAVAASKADSASVAEVKASVQSSGGCTSGSCIPMQ